MFSPEMNASTSLNKWNTIWDTAKNKHYLDEVSDFFYLHKNNFVMDNTKSFFGDETEPLTPPSSDEKTMALLAHIITIVSSFIGPLIIYLIKKDDSEFVTEHAKESLNFQITMALAYVVSIILMVVLIGILLVALVSIVTLVLVIVATIKASEGKRYRYPICIRFIK